MAKVVLDITMSLDGYVAGPDDVPGKGLGEGGERLHWWVFGGPWTYQDEERLGSATGVDREVLDEAFDAAGAVIVGRTMFDNSGRWGNANPFGVPVFVVTHRGSDDPGTGEQPFVFVTDGIESALARAKTAAGDKHVGIGGGANIAQQYLKAGLVDEVQLHVAPMLLGAGKRLFDGTGRVGLVPTRVLESPYATHLRYRVEK
jgi:Dihydrofolate reductase